MSASFILILILCYFLVLVGISYLTSSKATNNTFFLGDRNSKWYLVAFGMIGASLSGVTFISIPGTVGNSAVQFGYMQAVFGYFFGYLIIAFVLLPVYYRMNLTSIYEYLKDRFGWYSYKTGAFFFLLSRILGASVRLLLVADVLYEILFKEMGVPFELTVIIAVLLIWLYTNRGGIKTIVITDTLQTAIMLFSVGLTIWFISDALNLTEGKGIVGTIADSDYSKMFFFEDINSKNHFIKYFVGGMFITIGMTGLDQDMMQKNLSCRNTKEAQKNMIVMASILVVVNLFFLGLGALLYMYSAEFGIDFEKGDQLFGAVALNEKAGAVVGVLFVLGLIAAAYSSADSALTSLTTSFSVDFLGVKSKPSLEQEKIRKWVHIGMSVVIIQVVFMLKAYTDDSAIGLLMTLAGFTYGPLIGMFFFGILTKYQVSDKYVPIIAFISMGITFCLWYFSVGGPGVEKGASGLLGEYSFGFELILVNGVISFLGLLLLSSLHTSDIDHEIDSRR